MSPNRDLADADPRLPPELEQEIFSYAIQNNLQNPFKLLSISKRIRQWLLPIVFRVVVVRGDRYVPVSFTDPSLYTSYGPYIQHILISDVNAQQTRHKLTKLVCSLDDCLVHCQNITDLALWCETIPVVLKTLTGLPHLTRLSIDASHLRTLLRGYDSSYNSDITEQRPSPQFPNITHLNLLRSLFLDPPQCGQYLTRLAYHFPGLTHVAQSQFLWPKPNEELLKSTLTKFPDLKVFVVWRSGIDEGLIVDDKAEVTVKDERLVAIRTLWEMDWEREVSGLGLGIWTLAERVVEERKKGKR